MINLVNMSKLNVLISLCQKACDPDTSAAQSEYKGKWVTGRESVPNPSVSKSTKQGKPYAPPIRAKLTARKTDGAEGKGK